MGAQLSFEDFLKSTGAGTPAGLASPAPPAGLSRPLLALWLDARGDWESAHTMAQEAGSPDGDRVHAYLHRKEGDLANAGYWYRRAGQTPAQGELRAEWEAMARALLLKL